MSIGSANDVGRAQLKAIPSSHDTSTMRLPGAKAARSPFGDEHQRRVGVLKHAVDHDVELGEEGRERHPAGVAQHVAAAPVGGVGLEVHHPRRVDRRGDRGDVAMGEDVDVGHAVRVEGRHRAAAGRPEANDGRPQPATVFTRRPGQLHGMQHRAVAGHLVVLVKDMQAVRAVAGPVVHSLKGDQRQPPVDAQLGDLLALDTVRPAPENLALAELPEILRHRLGEQDDIALREELVMGAQAGHIWRQPLVGHAETLAISALEVDASAQVGLDPLDVQRVDRQPALVLLPRSRHDSEAQLIHAPSLDRPAPPADKRRTTRRNHPLTWQFT